MAQKKVQDFFQSPLFWDVDMTRLEIDTHARFIIERVITRGNLGDWKTLLTLYGKNKVQEEVVAIRFLDHRSLQYLSVYFDLEAEAFRCRT